MATKQTSSGSSQARKSPGTRSGAAGKGAAQTGERDEHYDVISVLYHALQGAETVTQYIDDARNARDQELLSFFEETRASYAQSARRAKQLLAARLEGGEGLDEDDEEDGADEDSDDDDDE
jgi:hypothetical protein